MRHPLPITTVPLLAALLAPLPQLAAAADATPPVRKATIVNVEYQGTKIWLPGTIAVKKGTPVELTLITNVPADDPAAEAHGFSIPAYDVAVVVQKGTPAKVTFTADREGVFPIICHLHPAHVGGQLIVLP